MRARQGDIGLLAEHFGRRMGVELEWSNWPGFTSRAMAELEAYAWPGNVRELRNVVERAVYRHEDPERPVDEIVFDPFFSPFAPEAGPRLAPQPEAERRGAGRRVVRAAAGRPGRDRRFARFGRGL